MESLFIINSSGDVFLEKHWRSVISKSICDYFLEKMKASNVSESANFRKFQLQAQFDPLGCAASDSDILPIHQSRFHSTMRRFICGCLQTRRVSCPIRIDVIILTHLLFTSRPPLFVIEFLHRVVDTFEDYFSECNETIIKENYVVIYLLLEEMLDNGFPLATESNVLKELIKPPNILRSIANTVTGKSNFSDTLPVGSLSAIPWRRSGVKYTNNEAYFDVIEEVDAIIDKSGATVFAEIQGYIDCLVKLSGMPDLSLSFVNPRLLDDVSFHPCVRFKRWETERVLSFIPPDGSFRLMSYHVTAQSV